MFAVIMAGGSGTRFWPASRARLPKQFLKITGDRTLFEETLDRVRPVIPESQIHSVVGALHAGLTAEGMGVPDSAECERIHVEPCSRNTAAAIGLAAIHIQRVDPDAAIVVLPADHFISRLDRFTATLEAAAQVAETGAIVTIGVQPDRPETGYGYLQLGAEAGRAASEPYFAVTRFVEKPSQPKALEYLASGDYAWNSGIFLFTARSILHEIGMLLPELAAGLQEIEKTIGAPNYKETVARVYEHLPAVSIDYGVMEKTTAPVFAFKADFLWSDVGSWQALYDLRAGEASSSDGNLVLGSVISCDAKNNLVYSTAGRTVALLGVDGLMIVDTPDALLVADRSRSQEVKRFPELLKRDGREELC
jgi:mannose-1-phosphate guanylyltransferase